MTDRSFRGCRKLATNREAPMAKVTAAKGGARPRSRVGDAVLEAGVAADLLRPETDCLALATELILLSHGWVLKGYLLRKGRTPVAYATSLVEGAVNGWATANGRKAWERRRG